MSLANLLKRLQDQQTTREYESGESSQTPARSTSQHEIMSKKNKL
jgi:hypothetical protein